MQLALHAECARQRGKLDRRIDKSHPDEAIGAVGQLQSLLDDPVAAEVEHDSPRKGRGTSPAQDKALIALADAHRDGLANVFTLLTAAATDDLALQEISRRKSILT
jgi:hypothetical protein